MPHKTQHHRTLFTLLGNADLQHVHLALHPLHHLTALMRLPLVSDEDTDDDKDDKQTDATQSRDHREAELERRRRSLVHQLANHV